MSFRRNIIIALLSVTYYTNLNAQVSHRDYTDHHVHLQDSATVLLGFRMLKAFGEEPKTIDSLILDADTVIDRLNRANFKKAWIISNAYWFGSPFTPIENEYESVKKQNDWTAQQAARYPKRLMAFMSVNPLKPYALEEIQRCINSKQFSGLKLHFANSKVNLFDKAHISQLQDVFRLANKNHLTILLHLRSEENWKGKENAEIFVKSLLPFAKNTPIVIAHMGGWGKFDKATDDAFMILANCIKAGGDCKNLYFDISAVVPTAAESGKEKGYKKSKDQVTLLNRRIKQFGTAHILFGTDWPLVEAGTYVDKLKSALGQSVTEAILGNKILKGD